MEVGFKLNPWLLQSFKSHPNSSLPHQFERGHLFLLGIEAIGTDYYFIYLFISGDWAPEASPGLWGREAEGLPTPCRKSRHVPLMNSVSSTPFGQSIPYAAERSVWAAQMWFGAVWGQFLIS